MSDRDRLAANLRAIREAFDASFASTPHGERRDDLALLAIRVGSDALALRVNETQGLLKAGRIVAVPSRRPELLGISGVRGAVIPIFSLARLTGRSEVQSPRWIALAGDAERIGLAFAEFEGHLRVPASAVRSAASARDPARVASVVELDAGARPIIDVHAIVRAITGTSDRRT